MTAAEKGYMPDYLIRKGVCNILHSMTLNDLQKGGPDYYEVGDFVEKVMRSLNDLIAVDTEKANEQHYELPTAFFEKCLGEYLKYSCCFWRELEGSEPSEQAKSTSFWNDVVVSSSPESKQFQSDVTVREQLTRAERDMLELCFERADIRDGMNVLELGCGWGSAALTMAVKFPSLKVVGVSYSNPQREFIERKAKQLGVSDRVKIITCDVNDFSSESHAAQVEEFLGCSARFDRVYSCEMFEHMRNWERLLNRIRSDWMHSDSKLFLHFFSHKERSYAYKTDDWMGKHFFTGGCMPSHEMIKHLDKTIGVTLKVDKEFIVNGRHYGKTSEAWLKLMDEQADSIMQIFRETYGEGEQSVIWFNRWRMFYLTVAEFFSFRAGTEWFVSHYVLSPC